MVSKMRVFALFMLLLISCSQKQSKNISPSKMSLFFDPINLGALNGKSNLTINARFSECGEWGGHREIITIYSDKDRNFHATYEVYPFNCDSLDYYYNNGTLKPILNQKVKLNDDRKKSIIAYIHRLINSKITERAVPNHANNYFSVVNSDSTFLIEVADTKEFDVTSFRQLTTEIIK